MTPIEDLEVSDKPFNRLTVLCEVMTDALDSYLDGETQARSDEEEPPSRVRGIIFLSDDDRSGIELFGYDDTGAGLADLLVHMKAMFASMGKGFGVMTDQGVMLMEES